MHIFNAEPTLARALLSISLLRSHALLEFMDDLRRLPLNVHVGKFIYASATSTFELTVRQEELAFSFGVSRVSMGKVLKQLEAMGFIRLGYGKIQIIDSEALEDWLDSKSLITTVYQD